MWLYVPGLSEELASAPGSAGLSSASSSPSESDIKLYVTLSGKLVQRPLSSPVWKARPWSQRLFIAALNPSTAQLLVDAKWSQRACPANHFHPPEVASTPMTNDGSGTTSLGMPYAQFDPKSSSWRTSQGSLLTDSIPSSVTFGASGTMRRGQCFDATPPWVPLTAAPGASYSRGEYPTPSATPYGTSQNEGQVPHPRPSAGTPSLGTWAKQWRTPHASIWKNASTMEERVGGGHTVNLQDQARNWPGKDLWVTPLTADDGVKITAKSNRGSSLLAQATETWPTPTVGDSFGAGSRNTASSAAHPGVSLSDLVLTGDSSGRQDPTIKTDGRSGSAGEGQPPLRKLNPNFVEALQGFPENYSSLASDCEISETQWSQFKERMRSLLWQGGLV